MVQDPHFIDVGEQKPVRSRRWVGFRRFILYPLLIFMVFHTMMTGCPIPLWHIERLKVPVAVRAVGVESLVLGDGRKVRLPFIKELPAGDPVFAKALVHGVEVGKDGEVYGLIDPPKMCGNDPVSYYRMRINLSDLAGLLHPDGIDDALVHPDAIEDLKANTYPTPSRGGLPFHVMNQVYRVRRTFEHSRSGLREGATDHRPVTPDSP